MHDIQDGSPLLDMENRAQEALLKIQGELLRQLAGKVIKDYTECKHLLRLLEEKEYDKLETALIERCRRAGFCLGDDIEKLTRGLLKLATISSNNLLVYDILTLIIRLVYQKGDLT